MIDSLLTQLTPLSFSCNFESVRPPLIRNPLGKVFVHMHWNHQCLVLPFMLYQFVKHGIPSVFLQIKDKTQSNQFSLAFV